jgi:hypothetical protein
MPPSRKRAPRESKAKSTCKLICCTTPPEAVERIRATVEVWEAGRWAAEQNYGPACTCGLRAAKGACYAHGKAADEDPGAAG